MRQLPRILRALPRGHVPKLVGWVLFAEGTLVVLIVYFIFNYIY